MFQEYPKALYRAGELRTVADADDEAQARGEGFDGWHADQVRASGAPALAVEKEEVPVEVPVKRKTTKKAA